MSQEEKCRRTKEFTYHAVGGVQNFYVRCYVLDGDAVRIQIICNRIKYQLKYDENYSDTTKQAKTNWQSLPLLTCS